jgi:hypothetical protein
MTADEMQGVVCLIGMAGALALREFERTFKKNLPEEGRKYLVRAWMALESMPGDAGAEKQLLRDALCKLRDEWQQ